MKVLFIGGSGVISAEVSRRALELNWDVTLLNRGLNSRGLPPDGAKVLLADIRDAAAVEAATRGLTFDVIADFLSYDPNQMAKTLAIFRGRCGQYIFVSSAVVYARGGENVTEDCPRTNLAWDYSRNKIACEERLRIEDMLWGLNYTIVRPNVTYGDTRIPAALISNQQWSFADRILRGKPIVMQDDGLAAGELTHSSDFAKGFCALAGNPRASREAYHIVSDECLTWLDAAKIVGEALGVRPKFAFVPSLDIIRQMPMTQQGETFGVLLCHKAVTTKLNNRKIKEHAPEFVCTTPFREGIRRTIAFYQTHPAFKTVDEQWNAQMDALLPFATSVEE